MIGFKAVRYGFGSLGVILFLYLGWILSVAMGWSRLSHIERLENPRRVFQWSKHGIQLDNGQSVMPKGMIELPTSESPPIKEALGRGIEVNPDGRVFCLMHVWHWCGNDVVGYDLSRIDLAQYLTFYHKGKSSLKMNSKRFGSSASNEGFSSHGWNMSSLRHASGP